MLYLTVAICIALTCSLKISHDQRHHRTLRPLSISPFSLTISDLFPSDASTSIASFSSDDAQNLAVICAAGFYFIFDKRPRGTANDELVEVKKSTVQIANLGLFAKTFIPRGSVIGTYPGVITSVETALSLKTDDKARAAAKKYMWVLDDKLVLDPTNEFGQLSPSIGYFGVYKANTLLARINEPPVGSDCNVYVRPSISNDLQIIAERDIISGEEIFIDYGLSYDRSEYGEVSYSSDKAKEADRERRMKEMAKLQAEIDALTLQPVATDEINDVDKTTNNLYDQDTTKQNGFLRKLRRKEEERSVNDTKRSKASGIISPEEAMGTFSKIGAGMFANPEDKEIIESLLGGSEAKKDSLNTGLGWKGSTAASSEEVQLIENLLGLSNRPTDPVSPNTAESGTQGDTIISTRGASKVRSIFERNPDPNGKSPAEEEREVEEEMAELLRSIRQQSGSKLASREDSNAEPTNFADEFGIRMNLPLLNDDEDDPSDYVDDIHELPIQAEKEIEFDVIDSNTVHDDVDDDDDDEDGEIAVMTPKISKEDAIFLQQKLDEMTDEEIKQLFRQLGTSVASSQAPVIAEGLDLFAVGAEVRQKETSSEPRKLPKAQPVDPTVRNKVGSELEKLEAELESLYENPLAVWQDLILHPEKLKPVEDEDDYFQSK